MINSTENWRKLEVKVLDERAIDALTAVELPDRHVLDTVVLIVVDASGNTIDVLSFNDLAAALNFCGQQLSGNVLSISDTDQGQEVTCQADATAN